MTMYTVVVLWTVVPYRLVCGCERFWGLYGGVDTHGGFMGLNFVDESLKKIKVNIKLKNYNTYNVKNKQSWCLISKHAVLQKPHKNW